MEQGTETSSGAASVPESPKPTAFTIDFGGDRKVDLQKHKSLAEKFRQRHKRGKSMSKLESSPVAPITTPSKKHPLTGNLPRKSSFQSEGYFSSDERAERCKSANISTKRTDLTLPLENVTSERMTHSFPNAALLSFTSPCDLQNVSSPEFELISPFSPNVDDISKNVNDISFSSEEANKVNDNSQDLEFDKKSDTVSEAGTYTLEVDNYSEEQKARMSIDNEFKIQKLSVEEKTEEYIKSLCSGRFVSEDISSSISFPNSSCSNISSLHNSSSGSPLPPVPPLKTHSNIGSDGNKSFELLLKSARNVSVTADVPGIKKLLSPILSPTQNFSIVDDRSSVIKDTTVQIPSPMNMPLTRSMLPNLKAQKSSDEGSVISVTSSGAFRSKSEDKKKRERNLSLTKSEVHVEAYIDGKTYNEGKLNNSSVKSVPNRTSKLTANIVNVQSIEVVPNNSAESGNVVSASLMFGKMGNVATVTTGLPPTLTGKISPSKIPSPIHTISRPRSRTSLAAPSDDFDTDVILNPTRNYINALQHRLSLDNSDQDSDYEIKYGLQLNNTAHLLKQRALHIRHNSLDDRTINNKLEHFQNKNLQPIDQTYTNVFNQYPKQNKVVNKINNSPSNSPIRRSNSFSNRNQINNIKSTNLISHQKDTNICGSPSLSNNDRIQRSSSTACIRPSYSANRRLSTGEHKRIDRSQFGDTESSSEEDLETNVQKKKDLGNLSNTRCNRTFSLRRARVDNEASKLKCPNTPDMRRKTFQPIGVKQERAISVDRKPVKTNEVQSRYLLSLNKRATPVPKESPKTVTKPSCPTTKQAPNKPATSFFRGEGGRFSMRTPKSSTANSSVRSGGKNDSKNSKSAKQSGGGRSNSSLSSREVEFQNWKRRKSYDPMKAAAEGKRKELEKRLSGISGASGKTTGTISPDSSPSHSGSVHRSQSFHGTAALEQLISSDEEDITFSADEGFSPPTPSPCELSPTKVTLRHSLWDRIHN